MPSTINADNGVVSGITGIRTTADNTGNLSLQANGVTLLTVATNNTIVLGNTLKFADGTTANTASSGGGGLAWGGIQTSNFSANSSTTYVISTASAPVLVTLPASPGAGNTVQFTDYARTWSSNSVTVNRNGANIAGAASNVTLNTGGESVSLIYTDTSQGWVANNGFLSNPIGAYSVSYLVVAGGGGGGANYGGGGGAGGLLSGTANLTPGLGYSFVIGSGGAITTQGANTTALGLTAIGGGNGGFGGDNGTAGSGGSGGGGGGQTVNSKSGGSGTSGQGNAGGNNVNGGTYPSGGGGGAGAVGGNGGGNSGNGGVGIQSTISGSAVYYAGGGGGGTSANGAGAGTGGAGGGGNGGVAGGANTGGGGGGNANTGGSGIVIISYLGGQRGTGGTVTSSGGYTIHTFNSSGTYTA